MEKTYKLRKPVKADTGGMITELTYDLESMSGEDLFNVQAQVRAAGYPPMPSMIADQPSQVGCVLFAAGQPVALVKDLGAKDTVALCRDALNFFASDEGDSAG